MKRDFFWLMVGTLLSGSVSLMAHPGHGLTSVEPIHSLTSPAHLLGLTLAGLLIAAASLAVKQHATGKILRYAGLSVALTAALIWGLQ